MLFRLEIENFHSIRDSQVIDLTVAPNVTDEGNRFAPIFPGSQLRAPKVVAVYGANGSGKTTVLRALQFLLLFAGTSANWTNLIIGRFNDAASATRRIRLAIEFGGEMNLNPEPTDQAVEYGVYRYEVAIQVENGEPKGVELEWLRQKPGGQGKWQRVFERNEEGKVKGSTAFPLTGFQHLVNTLRPHASVIASFGLFQHPTAAAWADMAKRVLMIMGPSSIMPDRQMLDFLDDQPKMLERLNRELSRMDAGVEEMQFQLTPDGKLPYFKHSGLHLVMPWTLESHGTQSFIKMFPVLAHTLEEGGFCLIDEFDSSLHPLLIEEILRWFRDEEKNPMNAQIWFTCHSASLLENLSKEEVVLTEKDRQGRTTAYSLMDVKVRRDDNLYRKYLSGALGGVPRIG